MAKAKQKSTKQAKAVAKKKPSTHKRAHKPPAARLSSDERASKLRPGDSLNELVADVLTAWALVRNKVRVSDVSPAKLASAAKRAAKATQRESALAAKQAAKLAPLTDARIVAQDAAARLALRVKRIADAIGQDDAEVAAAFADVSARFARSPAAAAAPAPTPAT